MTIEEFKAWLSGYEEALGECPTPEQWKRIREQIKKVSAGPAIDKLGGVPPIVRWGDYLTAFTANTDRARMMANNQTVSVR